jgi:solute carrier family 25 (peroxisomal adenine nucleotide transporter), member 17
LRREGLLGLYNGFHSSLLGIAVTNGCVTPILFFDLYPRVYILRRCNKSVLLFLREHKGRHNPISKREQGPLNSRIHACWADRWFSLPPIAPVLSLFRFFSLVGSATTVISNPVWVIQTAQTVHEMNTVSAGASTPPPPRHLGLLATASRLLHTGGPAAFFRGLGPALVLVVNPILQYTVFEQLKNALVRRRRMAGRVGALLTDWDFFLLGAVSKLGGSQSRPRSDDEKLMRHT